MKKFYGIVLLVLAAALLALVTIALTSNNPAASNLPPSVTTPAAATPTATSTTTAAEVEGPQSERTASNPPTAAPSPTPSPTPDPYSELYGCEMSVQFMSGPLEPRTTDFTVLGQDYFSDKADKFAPGKGTGIFYLDQRYFIVHSSYVNGNILKPMEAEFIRRYLEYWGGTDVDYIQEQIDGLIGTDALWICDGSAVFKTRITGVTRLSHAASERLWLEPESLEQILIDQEGLASEWVGRIDLANDPALYLGFCGWGPNDSDQRFTYFRYLLQFSVIS